MKLYFEKLYKKSSIEFFDVLKKMLKKEQKLFIVTANPEAFMFGEKDENFNQLLLDDNTIITPDGVGIIKAARILKYEIEERIPGIDIATKLLEYANEMKKSVYLYGANQEVIDGMKKVMKEKYPNAKLLGAENGYSKEKDKDFEKIAKLSPDIVLVALGIPSQEKLIYKHFSKFNKGIFVGVGGSFDVISGTKKRAPKLFQKLNLEWLYRIVKEPKRIKRFYDSNVKFIFRIINKKKIINLIFLLIFFLILLGGFLKPLLKSNAINYYENRPAYVFENPSIERILDNSFQKNIEDTYSDQIPLASFMKKNYNYTTNLLKSTLNEYLYKNYDQYRVFNSLLKFKDSIVYYNVNTEIVSKELDKKIANYNSYFSKFSDLDFYVYYVEKDSDIYFANNEKMLNYEYLQERLNINKNNISKFAINSYEDFNNYFYKTDHHWNYKGSYKAYTEVVNMISTEQPIKYEEEKCFNIKFSGSKASATGVADVMKEDFCAYRFNLPVHKTYLDNELKIYGNQNAYFNTNKSDASYGDFYGWDNAIIEFDYNKNEKENILIFGESYDNAIIELLASHFNKTYAVDLRNYKDIPFDFSTFVKENKIDKVLLIGNLDFFTMEEFNLKG